GLPRPRRAGAGGGRAGSRLPGPRPPAGARQGNTPARRPGPRGHRPGGMPGGGSGASSARDGRVLYRAGRSAGPPGLGCRGLSPESAPSGLKRPRLRLQPWAGQGQIGAGSNQEQRDEEAAMAGSVNKVILVGNLGRDPEVRSTQDGMKIVNLSLATSETWRDKNSGERRDRTEWHRVVIFNERLAEVAEKFLKKGSKIYV